jgi:hypothetical protein
VAVRASHVRTARATGADTAAERKTAGNATTAAAGEELSGGSRRTAARAPHERSPRAFRPTELAPRGTYSSARFRCTRARPPCRYRTDSRIRIFGKRRRSSSTTVPAREARETSSRPWSRNARLFRPSVEMVSSPRPTRFVLSRDTVAPKNAFPTTNRTDVRGEKRPAGNSTEPQSCPDELSPAFFVRALPRSPNHQVPRYLVDKRFYLFLVVQ